MADFSFTRRSIMSAMAVAPVVIAAPAVASTQSPFRIAEAQYRAAIARFNSLPKDLERADPDRYEKEERRYLDATRAVDRAPCQTWEEFADAFTIACDDGESLPNEDLVYKMLADIRRLRGRG